MRCPAKVRNLISPHRASPEPVSPEHAFFTPEPNSLNYPALAAESGVPMQPFTGYVPNRARMNGDDINPNTLQTMRVAFFDGVQLFNGVDGITSKRFGPGQFYVVSDAYPGQTAMVPHGLVKSQMLTPADIAGGPAGRAGNQPDTPGSPGGPVLPSGVPISYNGGC